jgi:hypothetical protein
MSAPLNGYSEAEAIRAPQTAYMPEKGGCNGHTDQFFW